MLNTSNNDQQHLVIIGGGFAGIELAKKLKNHPLQVTLLDRNNYFTFQPLLYQVATGGLEPHSVAYPYRQLFRNADNIQFRMAEVESIDSSQKIVQTDSGSVRYDQLVLATGSRPNFFGLNERLLYPLKSLPNALAMRNWLLSKFEQATKISDPQERDAIMNVLIVGGGPTGVELAGALGEMKKFILPKDFPELDPDKMRIILVEGMDQLLPAMSEISGKKAGEYLKKLGIEIHLNQLIKEYDGYSVNLNGEEIPTYNTIWTAGVGGNAPDGFNGEQLKNGRIRVDKFHRVLGYNDVYAAGDLAAMITDEYPRGHPMLAPVAIQQGKHLAGNLIRKSKGKNIKPFQYKDNGTMATVGRNRAVVEMGKVKFQGFWAWMAWMSLHLISLVGFRNKLVVMINWIYNYFRYDKSLRMIIHNTSALGKEEMQSAENQ